MMRPLIIAAMLIVTVPACALEIGARACRLLQYAAT